MKRVVAVVMALMMSLTLFAGTADAGKGCLPGYYPWLSGYSGLIVCRRLPYTGVW